MNDDAIGWLGFGLFAAIPLAAVLAQPDSLWWVLPFNVAPFLGVAVAFYVMPVEEPAVGRPRV